MTRNLLVIGLIRCGFDIKNVGLLPNPNQLDLIRSDNTFGQN